MVQLTVNNPYSVHCTMNEEQHKKLWDLIQWENEKTKPRPHNGRHNKDRMTKPGKSRKEIMIDALEFYHSHIFREK